MESVSSPPFCLLAEFCEIGVVVVVDVSIHFTNSASSLPLKCDDGAWAAEMLEDERRVEASVGDGDATLLWVVVVTSSRLKCVTSPCWNWRISCNKILIIFFDFIHTDLTKKLAKN